MRKARRIELDGKGPLSSINTWTTWLGMKIAIEEFELDGDVIRSLIQEEDYQRLYPDRIDTTDKS